jgi:hypothetical protein
VVKRLGGGNNFIWYKIPQQIENLGDSNYKTRLVSLALLEFSGRSWNRQ